jgi:ribosomal protein S27E
MLKPEFKIKKGKYKSCRGGNSKILNLHCRKCDHIVVVYQKDGPGSLLRLYFDRILAPENLIGLQNKDINNISTLKCQNCGKTIASPYIYLSEKRGAFRLFYDTIIKRIKK